MKHLLVHTLLVVFQNTVRKLYFKLTFNRAEFYYYAVNKILTEFQDAFVDRKEVSIVLATLKEHIEVLNNKHTKTQILIKFDINTDFERFIMSPEVLRKYIRYYKEIMVRSSRTKVNSILQDLKVKMTADNE